MTCAIREYDTQSTWQSRSNQSVRSALTASQDQSRSLSVFQQHMSWRSGRTGAEAESPTQRMYATPRLEGVWVLENGEMFVWMLKVTVM